MKLPETYCLTFTRGVGPATALRRFGAAPDAVGPATLADVARSSSFDAGYPDVVLAAGFDGWAVTFEDNGYLGTQRDVLGSLSFGSESVCVFMGMNTQEFSYAVDGVVQVHFEASRPYDRDGAAPDSLLPRMRQARLDFTLDEIDEDVYGELDSRMLHLAELVTGVRVDGGLLERPLLGADVLETPAPPAQTWESIGLHRYDPVLAELLAGTDPGRLRTVAVAEARRRVAHSDVGDHPEIAAALADAELPNGQETADRSALHQLVRTWARQARLAGSSTNSHDSWRMSDQERYAAFARLAAGKAVRDALLPDPRLAVYDLLRVNSSRAPAPGGESEQVTTLRSWLSR